jgi:basic membrane lipoprotein Med (substrate-binding protein (PBP1-ABC) superfamily)
MSEDKAREAAHAYAHSHFDVRFETVSFDNAEAAFLAGYAAARELMRWIACSERLPEMDRMVLWWSVKDGFYAAMYTHNDGSWSNAVPTVCPENLSEYSHWAVLPDPPKV